MVSLCRRCFAKYDKVCSGPLLAAVAYLCHLLWCWSDCQHDASTKCWPHQPIADLHIHDHKQATATIISHAAKDMGNRALPHLEGQCLLPLVEVKHAKEETRARCEKHLLGRKIVRAEHRVRA